MGEELSGAEYLASIYGTEKDKVNCAFFFKTGACRHGDKCSRKHIIPSFSQTVLLKNFYHNPVVDPRQADAFQRAGQVNSDEQQYFDDFYEEVYTELESKYGDIEQMEVCENIGEHMIGNVYVKFNREEDAERCAKALDDRWFNGNAIYVELSPVTDFREGSCRQHELGNCRKGAFCNFMHLKSISDSLRRNMFSGRRSSRTGGGAYKDERNRGRDRGGYDRDRDRGDWNRDRGSRDWGRGGRDRDRRYRY